MGSGDGIEPGIPLFNSAAAENAAALGKAAAGAAH